MEGIQPSQNLVAMATHMFKKAWAIEAENEAARKLSAKNKIADIEKKTEKLLDQIVDAENASLVQAYEKKISKLETEKLILIEQMENTAQNKRPFEEMFELSLRFLSSPCKIWQIGALEHRHTVLKLAFADRIGYCRKSGFSNPKLSNVFKAIEGIGLAKSQMAVY